MLKALEGGASAGVNDAVEDGGGPAGVVEGLSIMLGNGRRGAFLNVCNVPVGVDGGLEVSGTVNADILNTACSCFPKERDLDWLSAAPDAAKRRS